MPRVSIQSGETFRTLAGLAGHKRRSIASYEHTLAEHVATEARLRAALSRDAALLHDIGELASRQVASDLENNHKLMHNLHMIVSLLALQSQSETNAQAASRLWVAANRVATIAHVHRHLHSTNGSQAVAFKQCLEDVCRNYSMMSIYEMRPDQRIAVEGIDVVLPTVVVIPLSLIVNELVTNAIKHGEGQISVKLERQSGERLALSVCNDGSVLPNNFDPEACIGLGMSLVLGLAAQIGGEVRIDRGETGAGTRFIVLFAH